MLSVPVEKRVHPGRLHESLVAAGLRVVTVRSQGARAEVVLEDGQDAAAAAAVAQAHDADRDPERDGLTALIQTLEDDGATQGQHLRAMRTAVARLLRRAVRESGVP